MQLHYNQLARHLTQNLHNLYWIDSDEWQLIREALAHIHLAAKQQHIFKRVFFTPENSNDWQAIDAALSQSDLFSTRDLIEVRLTSLQLSKEITNLLIKIFNEPSPHLLLFTSPKIDKNLIKTNWYKTLDEKGIIVSIWPLTPQQLPQWLKHHAQQHNLLLDNAAIQYLIERNEGNIIALSQEILKLTLLPAAEKIITVAMIKDIVAENARYTIYDFSQMALLGQAPRIVLILNHLKQTGIEPTLILWTLCQEIRELLAIYDLSPQWSLEQIFKQRQIWPKRQESLKYAMKRHNWQTCYEMLIHAQHIDTLIKTGEVTVWIELEKLALRLGGK